MKRKQYQAATYPPAVELPAPVVRPKIKIEIPRSSYTDAPEPKPAPRARVPRCICCGGIGVAHD